MFFKYLRPIIAPFEKLKLAFVRKKMVVGKVKMDAQRVKGYKGRVQGYGKDAKGKAGKLKGKAGKLKGKAGKLKGKAADAKGNMPGGGKAQGGGQPQGRGGPPPAAAPRGAPVQAQRSGGPPPAAPAPAGGGGGGGAGGEAAVGNGIKESGFWFFKKRVCEGCSAKMDKTWESCPYCAQNKPAEETAAPAPQKTQAFMIDPTGGGRSIQLLGWIVPVQGPQRGELFTLSPVSKVGTDPTCTVCLSDTFMSSEHAEIFAEDGVWVLKDLGSTNGTFVNDKRIDKQELVDNDVVKFGQSTVKFKSL